MTVIKQDDLIQSVADALQFISYYHPVDFIQAMHEAYLREESPAAKDSMAQILINSRMCATGHRPICQDTGIVTVFIKVGMDVRWDGATMSVDDMINEGVRRAYNLPENVLRASILADPAGARKNTKDNTPAVIHYSIVPGDKVEVDVAAKGGGSENKSKMAMLNPSDSIVDWVLKTVPEMGAGWCPPGMLGIGIGGTAEKAAVMDQFKQGRLQLLVATTVIEVGVDVPNASLMIIENPERLGLAQLHQLRGRVGRGSAASHCVLLYHPPLSQLGRQRLGIMRETSDGFVIAEKDLELRGPGEMLGTRQTGLLQFKVADLMRDADLLPAVRDAALRLLAEWPQHVSPLLERWLRHGQQYGQV